MKRGDLAKQRWIASAVDAASECRTASSVLEAADLGMCWVLAGAERGGSGLGLATRRRALREWSAWRALVAARLTAIRAERPGYGADLADRTEDLRELRGRSNPWVEPAAATIGAAS